MQYGNQVGLHNKAVASNLSISSQKLDDNYILTNSMIQIFENIEPVE